jgi:hypothetical protein
VQDTVYAHLPRLRIAGDWWPECGQLGVRCSRSSRSRSLATAIATEPKGAKSDLFDEMVFANILRTIEQPTLR